MKVYIKESACISAQNTFDVNSLEFNDVRNKSIDNKYVLASDPDFKTYIAARKLRRVCTIIRRAMVSSLEILKKAEIDNPDAIVVGTGLGCLHETVSFLETMTADGENFLNPSHFIQSTHNAIAGQIALMLSCNNYNMTFTQKTLSFESALIDSLSLFAQNEAENILLGGIDEIDTRVIDRISNLSCYKNQILGEGSAFFVLTKQVADIELVGNEISFEKPIDIASALKKHDITNIDLVISGEHNKENDYDLLNNTCKNASFVKYKQFFGVFDTAIALAMWLGHLILKEQTLPKAINISTYQNPFNHCAIFNAEAGKQSLILLRRV